MHEEYDKRRRYLVKELNNMGLECFEPKGAFYVFPKVSSTGMNGEEFGFGKTIYNNSSLPHTI